MSVEFKDYYKILGVSRDASDDDIKKAFRKLARLYHPDVAKDKKTAEAKFKEINEAHEVLSDPEQRRKYDELGANWKAGGVPPSRGAGPGGSGEDFHFGGTGFSDFFEQFFGRGGRRDASAGSPFGRAGRYAEDQEYAERGADIRGDLLVTLDEVMNGSTRALTLQRTDPRTGEPEKQTFNVKIPPGVREGQSIRVRGQGQAGLGGADAGDLYLRVRVAAHPDFQVRGTDLYHDLDLAPWEAVLGTQVVVPTLAKTIKLRVPAGTVSGQQLRVRDHGMPKGKEGGRGDLYVVIRVQVPATITAEEKALWEKLSTTSRFDARAEET